MYSPTLNVLVLVLTILRTSRTLPSLENSKKPAGFMSHQDSHLGMYSAPCTSSQRLMPAIELKPRAMGVVGSFDYPSMAENARGNDEETWQIHLRTIESVLPIQFAANILGQFYMQAKETVNNFMGRNIEVQDFTLHLGDVALEVLCRTSSICWGIVLVFLEEMENRLANGLVAMYEGQVVNIANGLSMWVKLTIRPPRPRLP